MNLSKVQAFIKEAYHTIYHFSLFMNHVYFLRFQNAIHACVNNIYFRPRIATRIRCMSDNIIIRGLF